MVLCNVRQAFMRRVMSACAFLAALGIPAIALARPIGADWVEENIPTWLRVEVAEIAIWQLLAVVLLLSLGVVVQRLTHFAIATQLRRLVYQSAPQLDQTIVHGAAPFSALVMAAVVGAGFPWLGFPRPADELAEIGVRMMAITGGVWMFMRQADVLSSMLRTKNMISKPLVRLVRRFIKGVILILGLIVALQTVHVDVGGLLAGLGIGGIGLAFAAKDTVSHMFGSLVIFLDRPFQIGDWVIIEAGGWGLKAEGYVEDVGFRTTRVRTFYNSLVYIPNARLVDTQIDNMELRLWRRYRTFLKLHLHTPEPVVQAFVEGLRAIAAAHPTTRKDAYLIYLTDFHEYALEVTFWIFLKARSFVEELVARQEVILSIISLARRLGIEFVYPTRTVHIDSQYPHEGARKPAHDRDWTVDELRAVVKAYGPGGRYANERFAMTHGYLPSQRRQRRDTTEI